MYLVLTAMLALNVAAETLQAFRIVDISLMKTYLSFTDKNESLISNFETQYEINPSKVEKWLELANDVHKTSNELVKYVADLKDTLALAADAELKDPSESVNDEFPLIINPFKEPKDTLILKRQDDLNISPEIMLTRGRGDELQKKIQDFREKLVDMVDGDEVIIDNLFSSLDVEDPEPDKNKLEKDRRSWAQQNFEATPIIASITLLSKLQIDVRNAESAVLRHLFNQIDAASFKVTGLKPTVIPEASYIFQGQEYKARIFLSAEDTTQQLEVFVNGSNTPLKVDDNEAIYSFVPTQPGVFKYKGQIKYRNPDGDGYSYKDFEQEYEVAKPAAAISPTKMNVLYKNLKNPISIAVGGISSDLLNATCTNGKMYKEGDHWIVEPDQLDPLAQNTKVIVQANVNGRPTTIDEMVFRVYKVPDPKATFAGVDQGNIDMALLNAAQIVSAELQDFNFDLRFEVTSFEVVKTSSGFTKTIPSNSYRITREQRELISSCGKGDKISFENIKARIEGDANDKERPLSPIILTVN